MNADSVRISRPSNGGDCPRHATLQRIRRLLIAMLAASALAVVTPGLTSAEASAGVHANPHGVISAVNGFSLFESSPSVWDLQMAAMHEHGVQLVRSDAAWADIQPHPPTSSGPGYQWSTYDSWVEALAANHLTWQPIIDISPGWTTAVDNNAGFAAFAKAVAARYGAGGSFWAQHPDLPYLPAQIFEIWNEEGGYPTYISPINYGPLYTAARNAIHDVDKSASVDVGGLGVGGAFNPNLDWPTLYLGQLFSYYPQLERSVDGFALHPYGLTAYDTNEWVARFRYVLTHDHVRTTVPIDLTEFGWPYQAGHESTRAVWMGNLGDVLARSNCGIREVAPYDWINPPGAPEGDFGFVVQSGLNTALRPAATAWLQGFSLGALQAEVGLCGPVQTSKLQKSPASTGSAGHAPTRVTPRARRRRAGKRHSRHRHSHHG